MSVPDAIAPLVGYRTWALGLGQLWSAHGPGVGSAGRGRNRCVPSALGTASPASSIPEYPSTPHRINAAPAASMPSPHRGIWSSTSRAIRGPSLLGESRDGGASPLERRGSGPSLRDRVSCSRSCGGTRPLGAPQRVPLAPMGSRLSHGKHRRHPERPAWLSGVAPSKSGSAHSLRTQHVLVNRIPQVWVPASRGQC